MNPYEEIRDQLIRDIIGIHDPFYSNAITIFIFLAFILFIAYTVKIIIEDIKWKKKSKERMREIERTWIRLFKKEKPKEWEK